MNGTILRYHSWIMPSAWFHITASCVFLYFVDRASRYNSLLITNMTHIFIFLSITPLYMLQVSQCSSSGDRILLIHYLVWLVCVIAWYAGQEGTALQFPPDRRTKQSLTQTNHTRCFSNTIRSPDDEHYSDARNM